MHTLPLFEVRLKSALGAYVTSFARLRRSRNTYHGANSLEWIVLNSTEAAIAYANSNTRQGTHFSIFENASLAIQFAEAILEVRETLNSHNPLSLFAPAEAPLSSLEELQGHIEASHPQFECSIHSHGERPPARFPLLCYDSRPARDGELQWIQGAMFPIDIRSVCAAAMAINCFVQSAP